MDWLIAITMHHKLGTSSRDIYWREPSLQWRNKPARKSGAMLHHQSISRFFSFFSFFQWCLCHSSKDCVSLASSLCSLLFFRHNYLGILEGLPWRIAQSLTKGGQSGNWDGCISAPPWNQNLTSQGAFLRWPLPLIILPALNVPPAYVCVLERIEEGGWGGVW